MNLKIPIETSARHIHLSQQDFEILFGPGSRPTFFRELSQPGQMPAKNVLLSSGRKDVLKKSSFLVPVVLIRRWRSRLLTHGV